MPFKFIDPDLNLFSGSLDLYLIIEIPGLGKHNFEVSYSNSELSTKFIFAKF